VEEDNFLYATDAPFAKKTFGFHEVEYAKSDLYLYDENRKFVSMRVTKYFFKMSSTLF